MRQRATRANAPPATPPPGRRSPHRSRTPAEAVAEEERLDRLCGSLLRAGDVSGVTAADLAALSARLRASLPLLFRSSDFVLARAFVALAAAVDSELRSRARPPAAPARAPRGAAAFDTATRARVAQIDRRHAELRARLTALWEDRLKPQYFSPPPQLRALRERRADPEALAEEEAAAAAAAQLRCQADFDAACAKLGRKRALEVGAFLRERRQKRDSLARPRTRAATPR